MPFIFYLLFSWPSSSNTLCWNMRTHDLVVFQGDHIFQVWGGWGAWPCMGLAGMDLTKQWVRSTHRYWLEWPTCIGYAWQSLFQGLCRAGWSGSCCQQWKPALVPSSVGSSFRRNRGDIEKVLFLITRFLAEDSKQLSCPGLLNWGVSPCWILQSPVGFWAYTWLCRKVYFAGRCTLRSACAAGVDYAHEIQGVSEPVY